MRRITAADATYRFRLYENRLYRVVERIVWILQNPKFPLLLVFDEVAKLCGFGTEAGFKYQTYRDTLLNKIRATTRK